MATAVARILEDLRERGGLQGKDIANIVGASPPTVSRWSRGNGVPSLRTQTVIAELRYVVDRLSDFYTPDETRLACSSFRSRVRDFFGQLPSPPTRCLQINLRGQACL